MTACRVAHGDVRGRERRSAQGALQAPAATREHRSFLIARVTSLPATVWPSGWEDAEVVDSVLVEDPPAVPGFDGAPLLYDRFARLTEAARYGRLVSVLA
jgi:hypothetical protein